MHQLAVGGAARTDHRSIVGLAVAVVQRRQVAEQIGEVDIGAIVGGVQPVELDGIGDADIVLVVLGLGELDRFDVEVFERRQRGGELDVVDRRVADRLDGIAVGECGHGNAIHLRRLCLNRRFCASLRSRFCAFRGVGRLAFFEIGDRFQRAVELGVILGADRRDRLLELLILDDRCHFRQHGIGRRRRWRRDRVGLGGFDGPDDLRRLDLLRMRNTGPGEAKKGGCSNQ